MPNDPEYSSFQAGVRDHSYMYRVEYQRPLSSGLRDHNAPCAVCHVSTRGTVLMIPAKLTCPYLMTEHYTDHTATFECVDANPASVPESASNTNGGLFHHVEAGCNGMPCPPYDPAKELTCVECSK